MALKTGRLPKKPPHLRFPIPWAHELFAAALPVPVYPIDFAKAPVGDMWGNDTVGDCGEAEILSIELFSAWRAGAALPSWTSQQAIAEYLAYTGGQDTGVVLADFLLWLYQRGRIKGFAPAPHHDRATCDSLMYAMGQPLYCGVNLTDHDQADFGIRPWGSEGAVPDPNLSHCIGKVFSDPVTAKSETWRSWAAYQPSTLAWSDACLDEAWVVITTEEQKALFAPGLWTILDALPGATGTPPAPPAPPAPTPTPAPVPTPTPTPKPKPGCLSIKAVAGSWTMSPSGPGSWTLTEAATAVASAVSTAWSWLANAAIKVVGAFLLVFLPLIATAATTNKLNVSTLWAAVVAGIAAAAMALDALIGNVINPGSTGTVHAVRAVRVRRWQRKALAYYRQLEP